MGQRWNERPEQRRQFEASLRRNRADVAEQILKRLVNTHKVEGSLPDISLIWVIRDLSRGTPYEHAGIGIVNERPRTTNENILKWTALEGKDVSLLIFAEATTKGKTVNLRWLIYQEESVR